jgi:hypothetical protein
MGSPHSARALLVRGLGVGLLAAVVAFAVATVIGEPGIVAAIGVEESAPHHDHEPEMVSRGIQSTVGLGIALLAFGASFGGLFGLAFAVAYRRLSGLGARATSLSLAATGWVSISLVPFLKYPANPPAVSHPDTIGRRTALYFLAVALSVLFVVAAGYLGRRLPWGRWEQVCAGGAIYLVLSVSGLSLLPAIDEVGPDFPASVLWDFRLGSMATLLTVWSVLGLGYGWLTERVELAAGAPGVAVSAPS